MSDDDYRCWECGRIAMSVCAGPHPDFDYRQAAQNVQRIDDPLISNPEKHQREVERSIYKRRRNGWNKEYMV